MQQLKTWIAIKQSTNLELNEPVFGVGMNVKELTHSQQQQQGPRQSEQCSVPPMVPPIQSLGLG